MSFEHLPNPKAAASLIAAFRKKFSTKVCMAPFSDHEGNIVSAHTLSLEAVLRKLAKDSNVYTGNLTGYFSPDAHPIQINKLGIRKVSVFYGFCAKHDAELFSCIENEPFKFEPKQAFMLAYRAAARECYLKRKQYESLPTPGQIAEIHQVKGKLKYSASALLMQAAILRGAEDIETFKLALDGYLVKEDWGRLITNTIIFPRPPSLAANFIFTPFYDMNGAGLQDYENLDKDVSQLAISVIPCDQGGAAIFSWLDTANSAPSAFFESVIQSKNVTPAIIHTVLDNGENFAISPDWYEKLPKETQSYLISRMRLLEMSLTSSHRCRPEESSPFLDDWGI